MNIMITISVWLLVALVAGWGITIVYMYFDTKHLREENRNLSFYLDIYQGRVNVEEIDGTE